MIQRIRYTKEEFVNMLFEWLSEEDVIEVSLPTSSQDQMSIIRNPNEEDE